MGNQQISTISGGIYQTYTTSSQEYKENRMPRVGQSVSFEDGRQYRFLSTETTIAKGQLVMAPAAVDVVVATEALAGVYKIELTLAGVTAAQFTGGYLLIGDESYRVKSNTAADSITDKFTATLYDCFNAIVAAAAEGVLAPARVSKTLVSTGTGDVLGAAIADVVGAVDAPAFYFAQFAGLGPLISTQVGGKALNAGAAGVGVVAVAGLPVVAIAKGVTAAGAGETTLVQFTINK